MAVVMHHDFVTEWPFPNDGGVPSPQIVAAWEQLGLLPTEKVPLWAAHWLVAGYDGNTWSPSPDCTATTLTTCVMRFQAPCSIAVRRYRTQTRVGPI